MNGTNAIQVGEFTIRDAGGAPNDTDTEPTTLTDIEFNVLGFDNIAALAIFDGPANVAEVTSVTATTIFSGLTGLVAGDDMTKSYQVYATFNSSVTDNDQIRLIISSATADASGSTFAAADAGGAQTSITGDDNRIEVMATDLLFNQDVTNVTVGYVMSPSPTVAAVDSNANIDLDFTTTIDLSASTATIFDPAATTSVTAVSGTATFSNLVFDEVGSGYTLTASSGALNTDTSSIFEVIALPALGWQITAESTEFIVDFDTTVSGVNVGQFDGSGYSPNPSSGQLNSYTWKLAGLSDGFIDFGDSENTGDFARGTSIGGVTTGGVYAFVTSVGNNSLGIQQGGTDFTPGQFTARSQNSTSSEVNSILVEYTIYYFNDQDRSSSVDFARSNDDITYIDLPTLNLVTPETSDPSATWIAVQRSVLLENLNIADNGNFHMRWLFDDVSGSGSRDEIAIDDIKLTFNPTIVSPTNYTYDGTNWSPSNPDGIFNSLSNLIVSAGNPELSLNTTVNDMSIGPGAAITISAEINFSEINLESTSASFSSLILSTGGVLNGTVKYSRIVNQIGSSSGTGNDLISVPLFDFLLDFQTFLDFGLPTNRNLIATSPDGTVHAFAPYNNTTLSFENLPTYLPTSPPDPSSKLLIPGEGYRVATNSGDNILFIGQPMTSDVSIDITTPTADVNSQWNLIGNPYPSYLDASKFLLANALPMEDTAEAIYAYNSGTYTGNAATTGSFTIINLATISAFPGENFNFAPGQGFFVPADITPGFTGTINFTAGPTPLLDMRTTSGVDDYIAGRNNDVTYALKLGLTANTEVTTSFFFNDNASRGLDPGYDAANFGHAKIFSHLVEDNTGRSMALQAVSLDDMSDVTIPLGVNTNQGQQVTFSISYSSLPNNVDVYLDDTVANTSTLLNTSDYVLTPITNLNGTGRFYLRFYNTTLSNPEVDFDNINIYTNQNNKTIVIAGQVMENTSAMVYDLQGRLVSQTILSTSEQRQSIDVAHLSTGVYVVQLQNASQHKTKKVIL